MNVDSRCKCVNVRTAEHYCDGDLTVFVLVKFAVSIPPFCSNSVSGTYVQSSLFLFMKHKE
jgi:hypothetical protein